VPLFSFPTQVNERAARLVAAGVALTAAFAVATRTAGLVPLLALGFVLRVCWGPRFSPLARAAMWLAPRFWEVRPVAGPPKRFAQGVGAVFSLGAALCFALGLAPLSWALLAVLAVFASLEAALAFCMGCWVYRRLQRWQWLPPDACVECSRLPGSPQ
jgi:hypothetical protein